MTDIAFVAFVYTPVMAVATLAFVYWYAVREDRGRAPKP
jgi:hypothetical protein